MRVDQFDFDLPEERIALRPARPRDSAKLLVVSPGHSKPIADHVVPDLPDLLRPGDALVFNDTRVMPASLKGVRHRDADVAHVSATLIEQIDESHWMAFAKPARRLKTGDRISFGDEGRACLLGTLAATVESRAADGRVTLAFDFHGPALEDAIAALGSMPLPPYIASRRPADADDETDYQTMFARERGAIAAPTAGLHFTERLMAALERQGVSHHFVTLHVGPGTFLPVRGEDTDDHRMALETGSVSRETADALNRVREDGGRIVAVGSTATRMLETATDPKGRIAPYAGATDLFITPGYRFRAVDLILTNFHLPRSTLFMLVAAFSGLDLMQHAYVHAIATGYRFYSYGDACLLSPADADGIAS